MSSSKRSFVLGIFLAIVCAGLFLAVPVFAQDMKAFAEAAGLSTGATLEVTITRLIRTFLSLIGIVLVVLVIYGGVLWMTSGGNATKLQKAKAVLTQAIIGAVIVLSAFVIVQFVLNKLVDATGGVTVVCDDPNGCPDPANYPPPSPFYTFVLEETNAQACASGIRNIQLQFVFTESVDVENLQKGITVRTFGGSEVEGVFASSGKKATFTPSAFCPPPNAQAHCFDAETDYEIVVDASVIESKNGKTLTCTSESVCGIVPFHTGSEVDLTGPTVSMQAPGNGESVEVSIIKKLQALTQDDVGVSTVDFYAVDGSEAVFQAGVLLNSIEEQLVGADETNAFFTDDSVQWNTSGYVTNKKYPLWATAFDCAGNAATASKISVVVRAAHCFNATQDDAFGETGLNCGGDPTSADYCGKCTQDACTDNSECATGVCEEGVCVSPVRIDSISPGDGAEGNLVTIEGTGFGDQPGVVVFEGANSAESKTVVAYQCVGETKWSNNEIVVQVPQEANDGPLVVTTSEGLSDRTDDVFGPLSADFDVNAIVRPGLCSVNPPEGVQGSSVVFSGLGFGSTLGTSGLYFKNFLSPALNLLTPQTTLSALVPNMSAGSVKTQLFSGDYQCVNASGASTGQTCLQDSNCGAGNTCVKSWCSETLAYCSTDADCGATGGQCVSLRVGSNKLAFDVQDLAGPQTVPNISYIESGWKVCQGGINDEKACGTDADCPNSQCIAAPTSGPVGQYVTIYGTNFGSSVGLVHFQNGLENDAIGDTNFPDQCGENFWHNTWITVKVPSVFQADDDGTVKPVGVGAYQVTVVQGLATSNATEFQVVIGSPGPAICALDPASAPIGNTTTIIGEHFGSAKGGITFFDQKNTGYTVWSDTEITKAIVPELATTGPVHLNTPSGFQSNSQNFIVGSCLKDIVCEENYSCCGDGSCRLSCPDLTPKVSHFAYRVSTGVIPENPTVLIACTPTIKSPTPSSQWLDSALVCLNAGVSATFTKDMDASTIADHVIVERCESAQTENCENWSQVAGSMNIAVNSFNWNSTNNFVPNSLYRVKIVGGVGGVHASASAGGAPMLTDFTWQFTTGGADDLCEIDGVLIKPPEYTATVQDDLIAYNLGLTAKGKQCIELNPNGFSYAWSSSVPQQAEVQQPTAGSGSSFAEADVKAKAETPPGSPARISAVVTSVAQQPTGTGNLIIDFSDPSVEAYFPTCSTACVNVKPWFRFKSEIQASTLNNHTVELFECKNALCANTELVGLNLVSQVNCTLDPDPKKPNVCLPSQPVYVTTTTQLKANTSYRIILDGLSIKSPSNVFLKDSGNNFGSAQNLYYSNDFSWKFQTKNSDISCQIDSISVAPKAKVLKSIGARQGYIATAYGDPDECDVSGQALQDMGYNWKAWTAQDDPKNTKNGGTDTDVAYMIQQGAIALAPTLPAYCSSVCLNTGAFVSSSDAVCGNATLETGEDCDNGDTKNGDGCSSICLKEGTSVCSSTSSTNCCGNKLVESKEQCDDGNLVNGDGCSAQCLNEGASSVGSVCGNGKVDFYLQTGGEDCDDGNTKNGDGCSANCLFEGSITKGSFSAICGNGGSPEPGEDCDDGNTKNGDGCSSICLHEGSSLNYGSVCGNATLETGEDCDNGDTKNGDGCSSICLKEGSSLNYSTPSFCGDAGPLGIGEECEATISPLNQKKIGGYGAAEISINAPKEIEDGGGKAYSIVTATAIGTPDVTGTASLGIECSCQSDQACGSATTTGCGSGSCCFSRPQLGTVLPASGSGPGGQGYCRNTSVSVAFTQAMDEKTFIKPEGAEVANLRLHLVKKDGKLVQLNPNLCPELYQQLAQVDTSSLNVFARVWNWLRSLFNKDAVAARNDCFANITYSTIDTGSGQKIVFNYPDLLEANSEYRIEIVGDANGLDGDAQGVLSQNGVGLCLNPSGTTCAPLFTQTFTVGSEVCELEAVDVVDHGKVSKQPYESSSPNFFSKKDETHGFESTALTYKEGTGTYEPIQKINAYSWEWGWNASIKDTDPTNVVSKKQTNADRAEFFSAGTNGSEHVVATATVSVDSVHAHTSVGDAVSGSTEVTAFVCEQPWPQAPAEFPYIEKTDSLKPSNFGFYYCMDRGVDGTDDDLPPLSPPVDVTSIATSNLLQEVLFKVEGTPDAIGVRVYKNSLYLSPQAWFKAQDFSGGYEQVKLDGYEAVISGNTIYAAAANQTATNLFSNMYVISYNPTAGADAKEIFQQVLSNWKFNANTDLVSHIGLCRVKRGFVQDAEDAFVGCTWDGDCVETLDANGVCSVSNTIPKAGVACLLDESKQAYCDNDKGKIQRDLNRLTDIKTEVEKLTEFGLKNRHCSVTKNISCVVDQQCPGQETCVAGYPTLQQGTYVPSMSVSTWESWNAQLSNEVGLAMPIDPLNVYWNACDVGEGYDPVTCFNGTEGTFVCPDKSHVYGYQSVGGEAYKLYTQLEYTKAKWNSNIDQSTDDKATIVAEYANGAMSLSGLKDGFTTQAGFCDATTFWGVSQVCGDGIKGDNEQCEPGQVDFVDVPSGCGASNKDAGSYPISCKSDCTWQSVSEAVSAGAACIPQACGNGVLETTEDCDDGPLNGTYGHCSSTCTLDDALVCGDGYLSGNEQCDCGSVEQYASVQSDSQSWSKSKSLCLVPNGQYQSNGSCSYDCKLDGPSCGDGEINGAEQCDGGVETWAGKRCSDGVTTCTTDTDCSSGTCGSGSGNQVCGSSAVCVGGPNAGKSCSVGCGSGTCSAFAYPLSRTRLCDDNSCNWNAWTSCVGGDQYCGNGKTEGTEQCDDGNQSNNDACKNTCEINVCGDGYVQGGVEACDNGSENKLPGTANPCTAPYGGTCNYCDSQCQYKTTSGSYCGDEEINGNEICDGTKIQKKCFVVGPPTSIGKNCTSDAQCNSNICATVGVCNGGSNNGEPCTANVHCGTGSCALPICANDCSGACPFTFQETNLLVQSELQGSQPQSSISLYSYLNPEKETPDNALIQLPACLVGTKITANVDNADVQAPPVDIVFVTDLSLSMELTPGGSTASSASNRRVNIVSESLASAIDTLFTSYPTGGGELRIGMVSFKDSIVVDSELVSNTGANKQLLKTIALDYPNQTAYGTPTALGVQKAIQMLDSTPSNHVKILVLMSDGAPYTDLLDEKCSGKTGSFVTEAGSKSFHNSDYCTAEVRYDLIQKSSGQLRYYYSAIIATTEKLRASGEHMSSMNCKGTSMSSTSDCDENDPAQLGTYAYNAKTKEGIELMYDEIIKSILSSTTTVSSTKGSSTKSAKTVTPVGNSVELNLPSNFECQATQFSMPLRTKFLGSGAMKFDNFRFTYCPAP